MESKIVILILLSFVAIAGSLFIYFKKGNRSFSVSVLSIFLFCLGLIFLEALLINIFGSQSTNMFIVFYSYMFFVLCLILPPTFYIYVLSLVKKKEEIINYKRTQLFYGPAIFLFAINLFSFIALYNIEPESQNYTMIHTVFMYCNFISLFFIFLIQNIFYIFNSWRFYTVQKVILQGSQSKESNMTLRWMAIFILLYSIVILLLYLFQLKPLLPGKLIFRLFALAYVGIIIYYGSNNYQFILEKIKGENLDGQKIFEIKTKLVHYMENEKPYLDYNISLTTLAQSIGTNNKYLSYLINKEFGLNFSSYINNYRIEAAKDLLSNPENDIYTIETIAEMTGFKSKSAFNAAFKKITSLTPSKYKLGAAH